MRYPSMCVCVCVCVCIYIYTYIYIVSELDMIHLIQLREELLFLSTFIYLWRKGTNNWIPHTHIHTHTHTYTPSLVARLVKNPPATQETRVWFLSQEEPLEKHITTFQYSCLENSMDRGIWWAKAHRVTKSQTWLKWLRMHTYQPQR